MVALSRKTSKTTQQNSSIQFSKARTIIHKMVMSFGDGGFFPCMVDTCTACTEEENDKRKREVSGVTATIKTKKPIYIFLLFTYAPSVCHLPEN